MSLTDFEELSPEQAQLILVYLENWKQIARSTERINRQKAGEAVKAAYTLVGQQEPEVLFFESPNAALSAVENQLWEQLQDQLDGEWSLILQDFFDLIRYPISSFILTDSLAGYLWGNLWEELDNQLNTQRRIMESATSRKYELYGECIEIEDWACYGCFFDFCISVMKYNQLAQEEWEIFRALSSEFYRIYPYQDICLVCDRPTKLLLDNKNRVHSETEPAIQFADGFSVYANRGKHIRRTA